MDEDPVETVIAEPEVLVPLVADEVVDAPEDVFVEEPETTPDDTDVPEVVMEDPDVAPEVMPEDIDDVPEVAVEGPDVVPEDMDDVPEAIMDDAEFVPDDDMVDDPDMAAEEDVAEVFGIVPEDVMSDDVLVDSALPEVLMPESDAVEAALPLSVEEAWLPVSVVLLELPLPSR